MKGRMKNEQHKNAQNHYAYGGAVNAKMRDVGVKAPQQNAGGQKIIQEAKSKTTGMKRCDR